MLRLSLLLPLPLRRAMLTLACIIPFAAAAQEPGEWAHRAELLAPNSEFAVAELEGRLYILGGYPANRETVTTVQVYDTAADEWEYGPELPVPNNHGMAVSVNGKIYLIGGQTSADSGDSYVDTVYELDPAVGEWVEKAPMPTRRSAGVAVVRDGLIYVAGGRPPRGHDFAVYDPGTDTWGTLPDLPSQRNHIGGAAIDGRIHVIGGRLGGGFRSDQTAAHEVFDPGSGQWSVAAPMLRPRSGINAVLADGCLHAWGGESAAGMFADHDYYDPKNDSWTKLADMPLPVHGVTGAAFVNGSIHAPGGGTEVGGSSGSLHNQVYRPAVDCR
ncbi:Kelch repeat-containing protein [Pseudochelatococcus sp. B33]